ncbi:hypothetical protein ONS96_001077 [Cadophora gregata f. sp. sojae]|nr:hypothetical protein ONS96_001077 [Cadophora gregata f. sp. sojae]
MSPTQTNSDQISTGSDSTYTLTSSQNSASLTTPTASSRSDSVQPSTSSTSNSNVGVPGVTINPSDLSLLRSTTSDLAPIESIASSLSHDPMGTPAVTPASTPATTTPSASTTSEPPWIPTRTSGTVTVETVTYSFNFLVEPPPRPEKDGKSSSEQVHIDFLAAVPKLKSAASIFDGLGSAFKTFSSAVHAPNASDKSVSTAGSGLLNLFHNGFSAAADIGGTLGAIGLSEIDKSGKLLNRFKQTSLGIFDLGETIKKIEPLLGSNLNLANGNKLLDLSDDITKGIGIGEGLKDLAELANEVSDTEPKTDVTTTPESTDVQSTPEPTTQTTPTSSQSSSRSSSSSSSSSSAAETLKPYTISTKPGTSLATFDAFVRSLPDGGQGMRVERPSITFQAYGTDITDSLTASIRLNPIIRAVVYDPFIEDDLDDYSVLPKIIEKRVDPYPMLNLAQQPISPAHLNLISQGPRNVAARRNQPPPLIPDYLMSPTGGQGVTIFVIDTGIDPAHPDFLHSYTQGEHYIVPNSKLRLPELMANPDRSSSATQALVPYVPDPDNVMSDSRDHGNCVSSLATGRVYGVAKRARLFPVKYKNSKVAATDLAIQDAFYEVIDIVRNRNNGLSGPPPIPGWAVLSFSQGFGHLTGEAFEERRRLMTRLLNECWKEDTIVVPTTFVRQFIFISRFIRFGRLLSNLILSPIISHILNLLFHSSRPINLLHSLTHNITNALTTTTTINLPPTPNTNHPPSSRRRIANSPETHQNTYDIADY